MAKRQPTTLVGLRSPSLPMSPSPSYSPLSHVAGGPAEAALHLPEAHRSKVSSPCEPHHLLTCDTLLTDATGRPSPAQRRQRVRTEG